MRTPIRLWLRLRPRQRQCPCLARKRWVGEVVSADVPQRDAEELREIEAGLAKYRRVVQVNPKNARAGHAGKSPQVRGAVPACSVGHRQAIDNDPSKALFHHHLGLVYACDGRIDDAIAAFQKVIELEPDHSLAHAALGGYYRKKGLEELAQKHIGIAMKSIFDSENEYNRACLAAICGNTDQALELLRVALMNKQTYVDWILRDPDLDFIRQDPGLSSLSQITRGSSRRPTTQTTKRTTGVVRFVICWKPGRSGTDHGEKHLE